MLHKVYANKKTFKTVVFDKGLNLIVSERLDESDKKSTVNSRGKSTLLKIVNFCFGSDAARSGLVVDELESWVFYLEFSTPKYHLTVSRGIDDPSKIFIEHVSPAGLPNIEKDDSGRSFILLDAWKDLLGKELFSIQNKNIFTDNKHKTSLSTRSLLSYFLRQGIDGYSVPLKYFANQSSDKYSILISYLIGLNPKNAAEWAYFNKKQKAAKSLDEAIKAGIVEDEGELEAEKLRVKAKLGGIEQNIKDFRVHENYHLIQSEADSLTTEIQKLLNQNLISERKLANYLSSTSEEETDNTYTVDELFENAGVFLNDSIKKTLKDVRVFHSTVIINRSTFLKSEIDRLKSEIGSTSALIESKNIARSDKLKVLESHGALEEFSKLQTNTTEVKQSLIRIENRLKDIKSKSSTLRQIKKDRIDLVGRAEIEHEERRDIWEYAMQQFDQNSEALYSSAGNFAINIKDSGIKFATKIQGGKGDGVSKMIIFCFDLMLIAIQSKLGRGIDFLFHDSIIYDGVDPRQRAFAIEQAHNICEELGVQYIFSLNDNQIPKEDFSDGFDVYKFMRLRLTDKKGGSLLGIDF